MGRDGGGQRRAYSSKMMQFKWRWAVAEMRLRMGGLAQGAKCSYRQDPHLKQRPFKHTRAEKILNAALTDRAGDMIPGDRGSAPSILCLKPHR